MEEHTAIELLQEVLIDEKNQPLPSNSIQRKMKAQHSAVNGQRKPELVAQWEQQQTEAKEQHNDQITAIPGKESNQRASAEPPETESNLPNFIPDNDD